jgi:hypothetical protein
MTLLTDKNLLQSQVQRSAAAYYAHSVSLASLRRCLPNLGTDQPLPPGTVPHWDVFLLDAR